MQSDIVARQPRAALEVLARVRLAGAGHQTIIIVKHVLVWCVTSLLSLTRRRMQKKKGEKRRVDMVESDPTTGGINMTDNFITDNAGAGASLNNPMRLMRKRRRRRTKNKKYVDGTGPAGWGFTPLARLRREWRAERETSNWLTDAAKAKAKSESPDGMARKSAIARIRWGFQQRLEIALMRAQARMIFNSATCSTSRGASTSTQRVAAPRRQQPRSSAHG